MLKETLFPKTGSLAPYTKLFPKSYSHSTVADYGAKKFLYNQLYKCPPGKFNKKSSAKEL